MKYSLQVREYEASTTEDTQFSLQASTEFSLQVRGPSIGIYLTRRLDLPVLRILGLDAAVKPLLSDLATGEFAQFSRKPKPADPRTVTTREGLPTRKPKPAKGYQPGR
eukprot:1196318-Prorocentrum_minimum.AAC.4